MTEEQKAEARMRIQEEMAMQQQTNMMEAQMKRMEQIMARNVLSSLQVVEEKMDEDIRKLNEMENLTESELDRLRDQRKERMKKLQQQRAEWRANGHGEYTEVQGEKEFFRECKNSDRVVVHFYRPATFRCQIIDRHMSDIARKHVETKFFKVNAEKSPFLVERLHIWMLPSIVIIKQGKTEHTITGLDEFGGEDDFSTAMAEYVLGQHGAINHSGAPPESITSDKSHVTRYEKQEKAIRQTEANLDEDADWWD